jgi:uroporphyrinogen III methyltransferase/synthase
VKVVLTRAREGSAPLADRLRSLGYEVEACPLVRIEPIDGPPVALAGYDWLVVTSARGVEHLWRRGTLGALPRVAAIGPGTANALRDRGVEPALVADESTQEGLLAALPNAAGRVLFAGAESARDVLARKLDADVVPVYRTVELRPASFPPGDLVVLASASAARAFAALRVDRPCVSIGPVTSAEAERHGLAIVEQAVTHDLEGLVRAVRLAASRLASSPS